MKQFIISLVFIAHGVMYAPIWAQKRDSYFTDQHLPVLDKYAYSLGKLSKNEYLFAKAYYAEHNNKADAALERWRKLSAQEDLSSAERAVAFVEVGRLLYARDSSSQAILEIGQMLAAAKLHNRKPDHRYYALLAKIQWQQGKFKKAKEALEQELSLRKKVATKYLRKAHKAFESANFIEMWRYACYVLALDTTEKLPYFYLALGLHAIGVTPEEVLMACDDAVQQLPGEALVYELRGQLHLMRKDSIAAISDLRQALQLDKQLYNARLTLADIFANNGRYEQAFGHYKLLLKKNPDAIMALMGIGKLNQTLAKKNRDLAVQFEIYKEAYEHYDRALVVLGAKTRKLKEQLRSQRSASNNVHQEASSLLGSSYNAVAIKKEIENQTALEKTLTETVAGLQKKVRSLRLALRQQGINVTNPE